MSRRAEFLARSLFALACAASSGLTACGTSEPARFYRIDSPATASAPSAPSANQGGPLVAIEVVSVPVYLARDPIATRAEGQRLELAEFDRWAEPLPDALERVIAETFEARGARIALSGEESSADTLVRVEIVALDGVLGLSLELRARWSVASRDASAALTRRSVRTEKPAGEPPHDAWAAAVSRAFAGLAQEIAESAIDAR